MTLIRILLLNKLLVNLFYQKLVYQMLQSRFLGILWLNWAHYINQSSEDSGHTLDLSLIKVGSDPNINIGTQRLTWSILDHSWSNSNYQMICATKITLSRCSLSCFHALLRALTQSKLLVNANYWLICSERIVLRNVKSSLKIL